VQGWRVVKSLGVLDNEDTGLCFGILKPYCYNNYWLRDFKAPRMKWFCFSPKTGSPVRICLHLVKPCLYNNNVVEVQVSLRADRFSPVSVIAPKLHLSSTCYMSAADSVLQQHIWNCLHETFIWKTNTKVSTCKTTHQLCIALQWDSVHSATSSTAKDESHRPSRV
jgi:hypothetical protein